MQTRATIGPGMTGSGLDWDRHGAKLPRLGPKATAVVEAEGSGGPCTSRLSGAAGLWSLLARPFMQRAGLGKRDATCLEPDDKAPWPGNAGDAGDAASGS